MFEGEGLMLKVEGLTFRVRVEFKGLGFMFEGEGLAFRVRGLERER